MINIIRNTKSISIPVVFGIFSLLFLFLAVPRSAEGAAGDRDPGFGTGGIVTTPLAGDQTAYDIAAQPDGKLVAAGISYTGGFNSPINAVMAVGRYNPDGSLDTSFGTGGIVTTGIGASSNNSAQAVVIQSDGKIVVAGYTGNDTASRFALVRYNTNGSLDSSFGSGGIVTTDVGLDSGAFDLALQGGKLVAAGYSVSGSSSRIAVVRYNSNGSLDTTFGSDGIVTTSIGVSAAAHAVAIQSNKVLVAGETFNGVDRDFALVRYNTNGTPDSSFGTGGIVKTDIAFFDDAAFSLGFSGSKIVAAGSTDARNGSQHKYEFAVIRYNSDGTLDTTFGSGGIVTTAIRTALDEARALAIQADNKILVAGYSYTGPPNPDYPGNFDMVVARYNTNGSLDTSFGNGGIVHTAIGSGSNFARAIIIQGSNAVVAGEAKRNGVDYDFALVRYMLSITSTTTTSTTVLATTTTTIRLGNTTTTTRPNTTTTRRSTTTTRPNNTTTTSTTHRRPTTTTTLQVAGDVGIKKLDAPKEVSGNGHPKDVHVKVKNFGKTPQTRSVSLSLDGVHVGPDVLLTLKPGKEKDAKFKVNFGTTGMAATLQASLSPMDGNPSNDTATASVNVKNDHDKDKNTDKDKDTDKNKDKDKNKKKDDDKKKGK